MRHSMRLAQQSLNPRLGLHHRRRDPRKPLLRTVAEIEMMATCHEPAEDACRVIEPKMQRNYCACALTQAHAHTQSRARACTCASTHTHTHTHTHTRTHNHRHAHTSTLTITFAIAIARARAVRVSAFFARAIFAPLPPRLPAPGHAPRPGSRRGETIN